MKGKGKETRTIDGEKQHFNNGKYVKSTKVVQRGRKKDEDGNGKG